MKVTLDDIRKWQTLADQGLTVPEIQKAIGYEHSASSIRRYVKKVKSHRISPELRQEMVTAWLGGTSKYRIAKKYGYTIQTVRNQLMKYLQQKVDEFGHESLDTMELEEWAKAVQRRERKLARHLHST
jgi:transposase-like protein